MKKCILAVALLIVCAVFLLKDEKKTATPSSSATPVAFDKSSVLHPALQGLAPKETLFTQRVQENPYQGVQELLSMIEVLEKRAGKMEGLEIQRLGLEGVSVKLQSNTCNSTIIRIEEKDDAFKLDISDVFEYSKPNSSPEYFQQMNVVEVSVYKDGCFGGKSGGEKETLEKVRHRFLIACRRFERFYSYFKE